MIKQTTQLLKQRIEEDTEFRKNYNNIVEFYLLKFMYIENKNTHIEEIELILNRQFLQGYMVIHQFIENNPELPLIEEQTTIYEVLNTIPNSLSEIFKEQNIDFVKVDTAEAFAMDMLSEIGTDYYDLLEQVYKEITYYGIAYGLLHQYPNYIIDEITSDIKDIVHPYLITPQLALIPSTTLNGTADALKYDLFSCSFRGEKTNWMGRITFNPYTTAENIVEVMLSDQIAGYEKSNLLLNISALLSSDETVYFNVFHVSSLQTLVHSQNENDTNKNDFKSNIT
ncbi:hypothetical protein LAV72_18600 [Lysinibacillus xylanilyticus]|uniref:hypothetical protein n=1 Tax=Lysinibacillus xylanilyticus TaxID=582475 RepID=UPI002B24F046|nr:hypothetical protein [Lysinibacillus xylanilyticus]MEB2301617.1 hypothetical protein [Lysinibacillus xylanilyticus]